MEKYNFFKNPKKIFIILFLILFLLFMFWVFFSFLFVKDQKLTFGGSSSVFPLMTNISKKIQNEKKLNPKEYKDVKDFRYISSGSSAAAWGVVNKRFDIGFTSKFYSNKELDQIFEDTEFNSKDIKKVKILDDIIVFLVNLPESCSLKSGKNEFNLSTNEILKIYQGKMTWKELNDVDDCSDDTKIKPINREEGSGTRSSFEEKILKTKNYTDIKLFKSGTNILKYIKRTSGSIGYISKSKIQNNDLKNSQIFIAKLNNKKYNEKTYEFSRPFIAIYLIENEEKIKEFLFFLKTKTKKWINNFGFFFNWKEIND